LLLCAKISDTAPTDDTDGDMPPSLGAICLHYDSVGEFQAAYVAQTGTLAASGTCNWVAMEHTP